MENSNKKNECNGIVNYMPQDAKNGIIIAPPEGFEVDKIENVDGVIDITFREKEPRLPKTWEEFCEMVPIKRDEKYIFGDSAIASAFGHKRYGESDKNILPDRETAEAVLALCQLIQLRECYNQGWQPNWNDDDEKKHMIVLKAGETCKIAPFYSMAFSPLYFKTEELRDLFMENFADLINKLKPLYGIKEGGKQ